MDVAIMEGEGWEGKMSEEFKSMHYGTNTKGDV